MAKHGASVLASTGSPEAVVSPATRALPAWLGSAFPAQLFG